MIPKNSDMVLDRVRIFSKFITNYRNIVKKICYGPGPCENIFKIYNKLQDYLNSDMVPVCVRIILKFITNKRNI